MERLCKVDGLTSSHNPILELDLTESVLAIFHTSSFLIFLILFLSFSFAIKALARPNTAPLVLHLEMIFPGGSSDPLQRGAALSVCADRRRHR